MVFSELRNTFRRLFEAIEFRLFLFLFFGAVFIYPFFSFKNLEDPWHVYIYFFTAWIALILVLLAMALVEGNSEESEDIES